jgi:hypothetical protein
MPTYTKPSDATHKIQLESHLIYAIWSHPRAHAGQEVPLEVKTSLVGNGAAIKITCKSEKGKKLDTIEGTVLNNRFSGAVVLPENVKPDDMVYFEVELPKHGLKGESNSIPVRPALQVSKLQWNRQDVKREDVVTMTCQFKSGVQDGDEATVIVYEHNPNSCDFKVVSIPTTVKSDKIEVQWEFNYQDDTTQIPTDTEMQPYQKKYANPKYYFMVLVDGIRIGEKQESGLITFKDWMRIELRGADDKPIPDANYTLMLANGTQKDGQLNAEGFALEKDLPPGVYYPLFPDQM